MPTWIFVFGGAAAVAVLAVAAVVIFARSGR